MVTIRVMHEEGADRTIPLPSYETAGAAGADIRANLADRTPLALAPGARVLVPTGLRLEIPQGFEVQIRPRSGLALKHGITLPNSPGTIDSDYRGELKVLLINLGKEAFTIQRGERIAQLLLAPVIQGEWHAVSVLPDTSRGEGGFGSTGKS